MTRFGRLAALAIALVLIAAPGAEAQQTGPTDREIQRFTVPGGNTTGWRIHTDGTQVHLTIPVGAVIHATTTFANLGNFQHRGSIVWCSDCTKATPCAGSGTGAFAKYPRNSGAGWDCD